MKGGAGVEMSCKVACRCAATVGAEHDFIYCVYGLSASLRKCLFCFMC